MLPNHIHVSADYKKKKKKERTRVSKHAI